MISIGWRNLRSDPLRLAVATGGVLLSVMLVTVEVGMLMGMVRNASLLIDRSRADLWVSSVDVKTFDFATPLARRKKYLVESVPGVERVEEYNVSYSMWKLPSGGNSNCQVIGFDPKGRLAPKLEMVAGCLEALRDKNAIVIDEGERAKLGNPEIGDTVEVLMHRAKVVGFTRGMRSFTTTPYVFTSLENGGAYAWLNGPEQGPRPGKAAVYFLVKVRPGFNVDRVRASIEAAVPDIEAHTRRAFSRRTRAYWLIEMGAGVGFLVAALLGLLVGGAIISQTLYAMTMERMSEFGVLKALGAGMTLLSRVVLEQAAICGGVGLALGLLASAGVGRMAGSAGMTVEISSWLVALVTLLTVGLCGFASLVSISRLRRVEPALVFRA